MDQLLMISEEMITTTLALISHLKETSMHVMNSIVISYQLFDPGLQVGQNNS